MKQQTGFGMRVLVLGGYGTIGLEVVRHLQRLGHDVTGLARSEKRGDRLAPDAQWIGADIATMTDPDDWADVVCHFDAVVNAAGALQTGARDNLNALQFEAICACIRACELYGADQFIQISAPGASPYSDTEFLRTKADADRVLQESKLRWTILRPGLVIAPTAYGGTSLLRTLAGFPFLQPLVHGDTLIQTVALDDVVAAVARTLEGDLDGQGFDLVEPTAHTLGDVVAQMRQWLGFSPARTTLSPPVWMTKPLVWGADLMGWLGWRSPLRSTSIKVSASGVLGNAEAWRHTTGFKLKTLEETLALLPASRQERRYARTELVFPVLLGLAAFFWVVSGYTALRHIDVAASYLRDAMPMESARGVVVIGAIIDILIGLGLLARRTMRPAVLASLVVSIAYLCGGTLLAADLWSDPLGPLLKILPVIGLGLALGAMSEER